MQPRYFVVLVTAPSLVVARNLARVVLQAELAACVNLIPRLESHYWWQGRLESSHEILLLVKTTKACVTPLQELIAREHPYDTPECIALPITQGCSRYLNWIRTSVARAPGGKPRTRTQARRGG